jgi:hypothetical protein
MMGCTNLEIELQTDPPEWLSEERVNEALASFTNNKAPIPDGIKPMMLRSLPGNVKALLAKIYAASIKLHYTPAIWRRSEIVFIPKLGKTNYSSCRAYRPL